MMRGQAFSTFKLMIAAVVAVAILGILLSILGGIQSPMGFKGQAQSLLTDVQGSGVIKEGGTATFSPGTYPADTFAQNPTYKYPSGGLGFTSDESTDSITVDSKGSATISACCESGTCYLGIGLSSSELQDASGVTC